MYRYALRPLLRPIARRARAFLLAEVRADIAEVRRALYGAGPDGGAAPFTPNLIKSIEAALLTIALEQSRDRERRHL